MMLKNCAGTCTLWSLALVFFFAADGDLLAGEGGSKPPSGDPPPPSISFTITIIEPLPGDIDSEVLAINEWGDIVGSSWSNAGSRPFVHFSDTGQTIEISTLFSAEDSKRFTLFYPEDINSEGQICGFAVQRIFNEAGEQVDNRWCVVRFTPESKDGDGVTIPSRIEIVNPPGSESYKWGSSINEWGDVAGTYDVDVDGVLFRRAFVYTDENGSRDIGDLGGGRSEASAINNFREVTGGSKNANGDSHAFFYSYSDDRMEDLGLLNAPRTFGGNLSRGYDINDSGVVVGESIAGTKKSWPVFHAFLDDGSGMQDLGTPEDDDETRATGINSTGVVVGDTYKRDVGGTGFIYSKELGMLKLDSLVTNLPANTVNLFNGSGDLSINDKGDIAGTMLFTDGTHKAYVLTPNP